MKIQMKHWIPILLGILLWESPLAGQQAAAFSLEEAIDYAWQNSNTIKNAQLNIKDAEERIKESRSIGLPKLNAEVSYQRYLEIPVQALPEAFIPPPSTPGEEVPTEIAFLLRNNINIGINLDAMLFDASYFTGLKASKAYRQYVRADLQVQQTNVKNNVIDAYLPALLVAENLKLLDNNISNLEKLLFETQELYKAGFVEQLDVDRLELSLSNLKTERENAARQKELVINGLKLAINYPTDQPLDISETLTDFLADVSDEELAGQFDVTTRQEVGLVDLGVYLNDLNIELNKVNYLPSLRLFGAYQQTYQGNTSEDGFWAPTAFIGVRANFPIFDGLAKGAKIQRATIERENAKNQRADLVNGLNTELTNARISYVNAQKRVADQEKNLGLAQRIYDTTQIKYREGVGSSLEVNQAEQSLYSAQGNLVQAKYDLLTAKVLLDRALGK
ncbi:MAG: TolC family protein [Bacteroidota bacterium]